MYQRTQLSAVAFLGSANLVVGAVAPRWLNLTVTMQKRPPTSNSRKKKSFLHSMLHDVWLLITHLWDEQQALRTFIPASIKLRVDPRSAQQCPTAPVTKSTQGCRTPGRSASVSCEKRSPFQTLCLVDVPWNASDAHRHRH